MAKTTKGAPGQSLAAIREALTKGRAGDAWDAARRALARHPRDAAILNLAGIAAYQTGETSLARDMLTEAAGRKPRDPEIRMNLGNVLAGLGDADAALAAYDEAHALARGYAEPAFNAGVLLAGLDRHTEAAARFAAALARDPDHTSAIIAFAETKRRMGDLNGARDELAALVARRADDAVACTNLAAVLSGLGDRPGALAMAEKAAAADPGLAEAQYNLGVALMAMDRAEDAIVRFRQALSLQPENAAAALNLGEAYLRTGARDKARDAFVRALEIDPVFAKAAVNLADMSLEDGKPGDAVTAIDVYLNRVPGQPSALAFKALALRDLGDIASAKAIDDDRFIVARDLQAPDGFDGIAGFNEALARHVSEHPSLTTAPEAHATRDGQHSGELLVAPMGPMAPFADAVREAFHAYRRRFAGEPSHPFLDRCPADVRLSVWGVVMHEGGHQVPHIHPSAWLSGVYYVEVPNTVRDDDRAHAGWIEFGRAPKDIHVRAEPSVHVFRPIAGRMLLFPSHFYHRTVPLPSGGRRISIAFDVMPAMPGRVEST